MKFRVTESCDVVLFIIFSLKDVIEFLLRWPSACIIYSIFHQSPYSKSATNRYFRISLFRQLCAKKLQSDSVISLKTSFQ